VWVFWPLLALAGGLGYAPLAAIFALPLAFIALPRFRPRLYMAALLAFFVFAAVSAAWSPRSFTFIDIDVAKNHFNVRSEVVRVGLLFIALSIMISAASALSNEGRARVKLLASGGLALQLILVVLLSLFELQALALFAPLMADSGEGVQNLTRNCLIMALAAPSLVLGITEGRSRIWLWITIAAILAAEIGVLIGRDVEAGLLAFIAGGGSTAIVLLRPRDGIRILAILVAAVVLLAPLLYWVVVHNAPDAEHASTSSGYRAAIWRRVIDMIMVHPVRGSGLGALRVLQDSEHMIKSGVFTGQYVIPNHPHSMLLQLWLETGLVGAGLLAVAIVAVGWRLPSPKELGRTAPRVAGLVGCALSIACVSFDLWNEWWWAACGFIATLTVVSWRPPAASLTSAPQQGG
jgi:O-antigen ligase